MPTETIDGVRLHYALSGSGATPLVLVHGSWGSHDQWEPVAGELATSFRVLRYDRRGHGESEAPPGQGSVREDVADLLGLIGALDLAPAWVVGNSFGAAIALRLAGAHAGALRGLVAHEPPLFSLLQGDPGAGPMLAGMGEAIGVVAAQIEAGEHTEAAERFMTMALAPDEWKAIPPELRRTVVANAPTFLDEIKDPEALDFDLAWIRGFTGPALLSVGEQSPAQYAPVVRRLAAALPGAEALTLAERGHLPHVTDPAAYAETVASFVRRHDA